MEMRLVIIFFCVMISVDVLVGGGTVFINFSYVVISVSGSTMVFVEILFDEIIF